jgi:uncharacterized damage-inducible protein DinB
MDELRDLFTFNRWANGRILEACHSLSGDALRRDLGSSFASVLGTLTHMAGSEWIWLERWSGHSPTSPPTWRIEGLHDLESRWEEVAAAQQQFMSSLQPDDLRRIIEYRNLKGEPFSMPLGQLMRHVVNHSTYHRGQVVTMLRQLGVPAPATDLVLYYRESAGGLLAAPAS